MSFLAGFVLGVFVRNPFIVLGFHVIQVVTVSLDRGAVCQRREDHLEKKVKK